MNNASFETLLAQVRAIATDVAAVHADEVDAQARFPRETMAALRGAKLLSAGVPESLGGAGCEMTQLATLCGALAHGCSASAMVLAMHLIEVACIARHGLDSPWFRRVLQACVAEQTLMASVTSEVGTGGDTRSSICAVQREGDDFTLEKAATTVSYGQHADALLVTARRAPDATAGDQVLVYLERSDFTLHGAGAWDTLGMRGTCSAGGQVSGRGHAQQNNHGNDITCQNNLTERQGFDKNLADAIDEPKGGDRCDQKQNAAQSFCPEKLNFHRRNMSAGCFQSKARLASIALWVSLS